MNTATDSNWKTRHPFAFGVISGAALGCVVVSFVALAYQTFTAKQSAALAEKRLDLLRPLIASAGAAPVTAGLPGADAEPAAVPTPADCEKFLADLGGLQTRADAQLKDLRAGVTTAFLAARSSEIDLDALDAKAAGLRQTIAEFQQTYQRIDPLISAFAPAQINQLDEINSQFAKCQRLSERFDNTLASLAEQRELLAAGEAGASAANAPVASAAAATTTTINDSAGGDVTASVSATTTRTQTTTTVVSQPGSVYTDPVYYYNSAPVVSLWFGSDYYYDPFWRTSYWPRYHHQPAPPRPPAPRPPAPRPPALNPAPQRPAVPQHPVAPMPSRPSAPRPDHGPQPAHNFSAPNRPMPPRTTVTIPAPADHQPAPAVTANARPQPQRPVTQPQSQPQPQRPVTQPQSQPQSQRPVTQPQSQPQSQRPAPPTRPAQQSQPQQSSSAHEQQRQNPAPRSSFQPASQPRQSPPPQRSAPFAPRHR